MSSITQEEVCAIVDEARPDPSELRVRLAVVHETHYGGNTSRMAREVGVSRKPLQRFLRGDVQRIDAEVVGRVALATPDVSLFWLLLGLGNPEDPFGAHQYAEARLIGLRI